MNLQDTSAVVRKVVFHILRVIFRYIPARRISAFGSGDDMIGSILVINLKRQPLRWRLLIRELRRFQTSDGSSIESITQRISAVDARDGRATAATVDVDPIYTIGDQLYVQPDARLANCFATDEQIKMTRQEIAVARSHVEVWKTVAAGDDNYVLVLEDDVWFKWGAAAAISRGWLAALQRTLADGGPRLLYLSYEDAGGTAERIDCCDDLFRPVRGLWFLSGYVLSRDGAAALLRAMPVIGPVDLWMNYRFNELGALALSSPAILQRQDICSDNSYSMLPYLARAGIIDSSSGPMAPDRADTRTMLVWTAGGERESLSMALAMLGMRIQVFDGDEDDINTQELISLFRVFDALVDAPLAPDALNFAIAKADVRFLMETDTVHWLGIAANCLPPSRTAILSHCGPLACAWEPLCKFLNLPIPAQNFPIGTLRKSRLFRDDRLHTDRHPAITLPRKDCAFDVSPWILPQQSGWRPSPPSGQALQPSGECLVFSGMTTATSSFVELVETFPGNLAYFAKGGVVNDRDGAHLIISKIDTGSRFYRSGAIASVRSFEYGHFEAEIKAARGSGLITGFFLHRDAPRQEIDVELTGDDPQRMLVNVYFNPGDDGAAIGFGYRGSPYRIDLGFDATLDFHLYAIDWRPGRIVWSVDGRIVHERVGWDPTPVPHLPMRLHANLWAPRSEELAGRIERNTLPTRSTFRNISVCG